MLFNTDSIRISHRNLRVIGELDEFKGAWRALGNLPDRRLVALQKMANEESVASGSIISGLRVSDAEISEILSSVG